MFNKEYLPYDKMNIFKVCSLISFNIFYTCKAITTVKIGNISVTSKRFSVLLGNSSILLPALPLPPSSLQVLICFLSL